jgi:hypothetical protein
MQKPLYLSKANSFDFAAIDRRVIPLVYSTVIQSKAFLL